MTDPREAIEALRAADERDAPNFDAVLARPRTTRPVWRVAPVAIAASLLLIVGSALIYGAMRPKPLTVPAEVLALSTWTPLTDALLEMPNYSLLRESPRLDASLLPAPTTVQLPEPDSRLRW